MEWFKDYFNLSKKEQNAMLILLGLCFLLVAARVIWPYFILKSIDQQLLIQKQKFEQQLAENLKHREESSQVKEGANTVYSSRKKETKLYSFDPNVVSTDHLKELGFKEWQIRNLHNYRKAGGVFYKPEDLRKVYGIKENDYQRVEKYIQISPPKKQESASLSFVKRPMKARAVVVDINTADTSELQTLKGVGSILASRIVAYREKLGGFVSLNQLLEIKHLKPEVLTWNQGNITVDYSSVRKLNINNASEADLKAHPYIGWREAKAIVNYRNQHGKYAAIKEMSNSVLISDSLLGKIAPYLKLDDSRETP